MQQPPRRSPLVSDGSLADAFRDPPVAFRPVPFWSWNEHIEPAEVRRQADLLAEAGLGGGFIHVRVGLTSGYMTDDWWQAVDAAVDQSRARNLKVWFYDEDRWPSGYAGGAVPLADATFRMKGLLARPIDAPRPDDCVAIGPVVDGLQVYAWTSPLGNDWFHGTCYGDLLDRGAMAKFIDEAYASYHRRYGHLYGSDVLAEFTDEPNAMHRSRLPRGLLPFTTALPERFAQMHGYAPHEGLHLLFTDGPGAHRFRLHYFRAVNDLFETNFSKQIGDWCAAHDIAFTGHYMAEHTLYEQQLWGVKVMANYRHQGVPGIDHLRRQIDETVTAKQCQSVANQYGKPRMLSELYGVAGGSMTFADRWWIASQQMCLGVNLLNPHLLLYTMAGCRKRDYPQNMFYQQPWWPLNAVIDDQLSRVCVALARGRYLAEALIVHPQESAFVHWRTRAAPDPTDRGEKVKWEFDPVMPEVRPTIDALDAQLAAITAALFGAQRTFDFGDETILNDVATVEVEVGRAWLRVGEMRYPAIVLPGMTTIAPHTFDLLKRFAGSGGSILRCGTGPTLLDGEPSDALTAWIDTLPVVKAEDIANRLASHVPPAVRVIGIDAQDAAKLYVHVRELEAGERLVFLTNLHRTRTFDSVVHFAGSYETVFRLDPATGEQHPLVSRRDAKGLRLELPFAEGEGHLLRLSTQSRREAVTSRAVRAPIQSRWPLERATMRRLDDNALTLDRATWREGDGEWSARPVPVIAIQQRLNELKYDGPLTLRFDFTVDALDAERVVRLVVEHPERYRIRINGTAIRYAGLPHYRDIRWLPIDVTGMLRRGMNEVVLECDFRHGDPRSVHDAFGRYGTEIESVYLVGDFDVRGEVTGAQPVGKGWARFGLHEPQVDVLRAESLAISEPQAGEQPVGDSVAHGLPFYAGRLEIRQRLTPVVVRTVMEALATGGRVALSIDQLDAPVASVGAGGATIGHFVGAPYEVDVTDALQAGIDELVITLYGTLRNLMGPHHHQGGEEPEEHPHTFEPSYPPNEPIAALVQEWGKRPMPEIGWRDDYLVVSFGKLGKLTLLHRR